MTFAAPEENHQPSSIKTSYFLYFRVKPVPHSADMPILDPPKKYEIVKDYAEEKFIRPGTFHDPDFEAEDLN
ncbi:hypothetical protein TNCT_343001 [Trichonephila clavata]|uniref:Uncharacterized protein n=1 Tax=Trichonephila clavata TaxID=2740835 RepID=A0A8X6HEF7_TRICU|nr:hypothetical protein TNCT_343001 [Trichonephila clavata]